MFIITVILLKSEHLHKLIRTHLAQKKPQTFFSSICAMKLNHNILQIMRSVLKKPQKNPNQQTKTQKNPKTTQKMKRISVVFQSSDFHLCQ